MTARNVGPVVQSNATIGDCHPRGLEKTEAGFDEDESEVMGPMRLRVVSK